ncbi:MAG: homoserine dehydrogenase [Thermomicrobiales bacterium]
MKRVSLIQVGFGTVGGVLLEQVMRQHDRWCQEFELDIRIAAVAGRAGAIVANDLEVGLAEAELRIMLDHRRGVRDAEPLARALEPVRDAVERVCAKSASGSQVTIVLDAAAGEETVGLLTTALAHGAGVVLSNKAPLALPMSDPSSQTLWAAAEREQLRYEATCGAGLPVISTLRGLVDSGDRVLEVTGCLSGTLGAIFSMVAAGESFSEAVRDAKARGYTEPDPRDDLSGLDVARKALILARTMGIDLDLSDVDVHSLIPAGLADVSVSEFMERISVEDSEISAMGARAQADGAALKYVAKVIPGSERIASVGLSEVPASTMLGALQGPENIISFRTERYDEYPLVVAGPGAGAEVTAAGMVVDMLAIAQKLG